MGVIANAWRRITRRQEKAGVFDFSGGAADGVIGAILGGTSSQRVRGAQALLQAYNESPWVRKAIGQIAIDFAAVRWTVLVPKGNATQRKHIGEMLKRTKIEDRATLKRALLDADMVEENPAHPAVIFLERGNPWHSGVGARRLLSAYIRLVGDSYAIVERGADGMPSSYLPIPSTWIEELPTDKKPFFKVTHGSWRQNVPVEDMLWIRDANPVDPYGRGMGVVNTLGDEIETDEHAARMAKAKFENHGMPSAIVGMEGMGKEAGERLQQKWDEDHRGIRKIGRPYFTGSKITVAKLDDDLKQTQFIEVRTWERNTIAQVIGVPPEAIGIMDNANRASAEVAHRTYIGGTLIPDLELARSMLQVQLMPQYDDGGILDFVNPMPEDKEHRIELLKTIPDWVLTRNQWLEELGREPVNGGDVYFVPSTMLPVESKALAPRTLRALALLPAPQSRGLDAAVDKVAGLLASSTAALSAPGAPAVHLVRAVDPEDVDPILENLRPERLNFELDPEDQDLVDEWGNVQVEELGFDAGTFNMQSPLVSEHLQDFSSTRITGINETTKKKVRKQLIDGVRDGEGADALARRVRKVMTGNIGKHRSKMIARTEVLRSSNFARLEGMRQTGIVSQKQWLHTQDGRTRDEHRELGNDPNRNTVAIGAGFAIGTASAQYPGDFGVPELDIQCRCTVLPVVAAVSYDADEIKQIWQKFDRRLIPWERRWERAVLRAFEAQERDLIKAIEDADKN
jgi:HK97 family phage portal protein